MALKRICRCGKIIDYNLSSCPQCEGKASQRNKEYDKYARDKDATEFYHSQAWITLRSEVISNYNGLCLYSLLVDNKIVSADLVHHIVPLKEDMSLSLFKSNLIPISSSVHNFIEAQYDKGQDSKKAMQSILYRLLDDYRAKYGVG